MIDETEIGRRRPVQSGARPAGRSTVRDQTLEITNGGASIFDPPKAQEAGLSAAHSTRASVTPSSVFRPPVLKIALFTGGGDKPYALGLATALTSRGISVDFIGSDDLNVPELLNNPRVNFLNLRGDQRPDAALATKILRVLIYYWRLVRYAATAKPTAFHILWNNKIEFFDRTLLMLYYKLLGKKIALTAHNVNIGLRDSNDSRLNRLSLKIQYKLADHIFVHTGKMKSDLASQFRISKDKLTVIPFGINNTVPNTALTTSEAKGQLGLNSSDKTMLFFGNIAPYKGLEYLIDAFEEIAAEDE